MRELRGPGGRERLLATREEGEERQAADIIRELQPLLLSSVLLSPPLFDKSSEES